MIGRLLRKDEGHGAFTHAPRRRGWNDGLFYELQLNGPAPDRLCIKVDDPYKADILEAEEYLELCQDWVSGPTTIDQRHEFFLAPWQQTDKGSLKHHRLHIFAWLAGLAAMGDKGRPVAQAMTDAWISAHGRYAPETWHPWLVSERLWQLARYGPWILEGSDALWRSRLLTSMARQTRHLAKAVARVDEPVERLFAAMTLILMGLGLPHHRVCEQQGSTLLRRELRLQLRADGGHISRNPSLQLRLAINLQALLTCYRKLGVTAPNYLHHAVGRSTDMVEFFRCGDGRLATFNEGIEDDPKAVTSALSFDSIGRNKIDFASQSGYQRLSGARSYLYVDTGTSGLVHGEIGDRQPTACRYDGSFAIQFSSGRQRIIVNCGSAKALADQSVGLSLPEYHEWRQALASAEAHSTLCVDQPRTADANPVPGQVEQQVYHHLEEDRQGQLLELERIGISNAHGCTHRRRLFLSIDGDDLRGEDILIPPAAETAPDWCLRFHLYPNIKASLSRDGRSVILVTPQNEGWRFIAGDAKIDLVRSIYCGVSGPVQKTEQIVVKPENGQGAIRQVKWALKK